MMGSPTPAVRVQCFDLKSEYDIKGQGQNLLDASFTGLSQLGGRDRGISNTKMTLKESLDQIAVMKAMKASPMGAFESPGKDKYALSSYHGSPKLLDETQQTVNTCQGDQQSFLGGLRATIGNLFGGSKANETIDVSRVNETMANETMANDTILDNQLNLNETINDKNNNS